jgi:hypothetical protein
MEEDMVAPLLWRPIVAMADFVKKYKESETRVLLAVAAEKKQIVRELEELDTKAIAAGTILEDEAAMAVHLTQRATISEKLDQLAARTERRIIDEMEPLERSAAQDRLELQAQRARKVLFDNGFCT